MKVWRAIGHLDIVIANAGIVRLGTENDFLAEWNDIIATHLTGVYHTVRAAVPHLIAAAQSDPSSSPDRPPERDSQGWRHVVYLGDARPRLAHAGPRHPADTALDPGQHHPSHRRRHRHGPQRRHGPAVRRRDPSLASMQNASPIDVLQPEDVPNAVAWLVSDGG